MRTVLVAAVLSLTTAGCVSIPSGGPVLAYPTTQGANGQTQPYEQIVPPSPGPDWTPTEVVQGFLAASASFVGQQQVARGYLTPAASRSWQPGWSATVFTNGPHVEEQAIAGNGSSKGASKGQETASVTVGGNILATLSDTGTYAVAATTPRVPSGTTWSCATASGESRTCTATTTCC